MDVGQGQNLGCSAKGKKSFLKQNQEVCQEIKNHALRRIWDEAAMAMLQLQPKFFLEELRETS
jgi:hypothetical protein